MNRRQRKKLHLAEFSALGFYVTGSVVGYSDGLLDDWIEFIESHGLRCGGSFGLSPNTGMRYYVERTPKTCTDDDRAAVGAWLRGRPELAGVEVHALEDVYYLARAALA